MTELNAYWLPLCLAWLGFLSGCAYEAEFRRVPSPDGSLDAVWHYNSSPYVEGLYLTRQGRRPQSGVLIYKALAPSPLDLHWLDASTLQVLYTGPREIMPPVQRFRLESSGLIEIRARSINSDELKSVAGASSRRASVIGCNLIGGESFSVDGDDPAERVFIAMDHKEILRIRFHAQDVENLKAYIDVLEQELRGTRWVSSVPIVLEDISMTSPQPMEAHFILVDNRHMEHPWTHSNLPFEVSSKPIEVPIDLSYRLTDFSLDPVRYSLTFSFRIADQPAVLHVALENSPAGE